MDFLSVAQAGETQNCLPGVRRNIKFLCKNMKPCIFHLDLDCFFVSAERLKRPELQGKPVAVGGSRGRGVISSASYEARKFGVRSAMPTAQALRLCPGLTVLPSDFELYGRLSRRVFDLLGEYTPMVEAASIDEGYLDMTGTAGLWGAPLEAASRIRARVRAETGLTCSVGIAANRRVAKIATDRCKPDGVLLVKPGSEADFLAPLPVRVIPGVGGKTDEWLRSRGIVTIAQLQAFPVAVLRDHLGGWGESLHRAAHGSGSIEFHRPAKRPSTSRETTFAENVDTLEELEETLWELCSDLGRDLREDGDYSRTIRLKLRYGNFETITRSRTFATPTALDRELFARARVLLLENWDRARPVRLLGVGTPLDGGERQWTLEENPVEVVRREKLERLKDALRGKFGDDVIRRSGR